MPGVCVTRGSRGSVVRSCVVPVIQNVQTTAFACVAVATVILGSQVRIVRE